MAGIYIHIPFCKQACSYCDFYFVTRTSQRQEFVDQLIKQIEEYQDTIYSTAKMETIYFGGGTPSLLKPQEVERILEALQQTFQLDIREITFEMNPDDVSKDFLSSLKQLGVNRASMGVQTFDPELLSFMNRAHTSEEALKCIKLINNSGFQSYTVDLIYGNPNQPTAALEEDLDRLLQFDPPHVSAYSLTIEPNTVLGKKVELGRIAPAEDDKVVEHFRLVNKKLEQAGLKRYEVSNYSQADSEALHNSHYWNHHNYLGLGPGAHSFWWDDEARRWKNKTDLQSYLNGNYQQSEEQLSLKQLAEERLMMGLRTREGVAVDRLSGTYDYKLNDEQEEYLKNREQEGKVRITDRIRLTDQGITIADAIILDLVTLY